MFERVTVVCTVIKVMGTCGGSALHALCRQTWQINQETTTGLVIEMSEPLKTVDMRTTTKPFSNSCVAPSSETSLSLLGKNDSGPTNRNEMHPFYYLHLKVVTFSRVSVNANPLVTMIFKGIHAPKLWCTTAARHAGHNSPPSFTLSDEQN